MYIECNLSLRLIIYLYRVLGLILKIMIMIATIALRLSRNWSDKLFLIYFNKMSIKFLTFLLLRDDVAPAPKLIMLLRYEPVGTGSSCNDPVGPVKL